MSFELLSFIRPYCFALGTSEYCCFISDEHPDKMNTAAIETAAIFPKYLLIHFTPVQVSSVKCQYQNLGRSQIRSQRYIMRVAHADYDIYVRLM